MERNISLSLPVPRIGRKQNRSTIAPITDQSEHGQEDNKIGIETGKEKNCCRDICTDHQKFAVREVDDLHDPEDQVQPGSEQDIDATGIQPPENNLTGYPRLSMICSADYLYQSVRNKKRYGYDYALPGTVPGGQDKFRCLQVVRPDNKRTGLTEGGVV